LLVFVDSSALKAYYDSRNDFHDRADGLMRMIAGRKTEIAGFVTTDYVLDEAITVVRFAHSHGKAVALAEATLSSRFVSIVYSDLELFTDGMRIFKQHSDKDWSFTDCVSFATMRKHGIRTTFTFDAHFRQAGFTTIP